MPLGPSPNPRLGFQASISRGQSSESSTSGTPEPHHRSTPAPQEETGPLGAVRYPHSGKNLHPPPQSTPNFYSPLGRKNGG